MENKKSEMSVEYNMDEMKKSLKIKFFWKK